LKGGVMSVRIVRTRNGEDIICDLFEVTTKDEPEKTVAFQLNHPYNVWLEGIDEPQLLIETDAEDGVQKISEPEINFRPWVPLSAKNQILMKMEEVVTAYETYPEVITKYNSLVEAHGGNSSKTNSSENEE
tara:strand:+ start:196 stop:588 length:393 start_codon:yes stop_codon:yes gene_type:complete